MQLQVFQAVRVEYTESPTLKVSVDGQTKLSGFDLAQHDTFKGRRVTLPVSTIGYLPHIEVTDSTLLQNEQFEAIPIENFSQQQLFHYYELGFRTGTNDGSNVLTPKIYLDNTEQTQTFNIDTNLATDTTRIYFDALAYGYIPHVHNVASSSNDAEILWARPVALPPRFYRGIRTHAEFQITYQGDVDLEWYLDGTSIGAYTDFNSSSTVTEKAYFPSGTIGHVLQYTHTNPEASGKVYIVETDVTLADLEQQAMRPQAEEQ
jgi:hypothetical protein